MAWTIPWNLIGLSVSGDVGDFTVYTNKNGKKVAFPRQPPEIPTTPRQRIQRNAFKDAQAAWKDLTVDEKRALEDAVKKLSMVLTGQNLYISAVMKKNESGYKTVESQSGIALPDLV